MDKNYGNCYLSTYLGVLNGKDGLTANSTDATANQQLGLCPTNFLSATGSTKTTKVDWIKMF